jgi:hypothetical protein
LYVQQLAATNPRLFNMAFGQSALTSQLGTNPGGILNNPAYGGFSVDQSLRIAQSAEGLYLQGLGMSPLAQQLTQQAQIGFIREQQMLQQQQLLQQQALAAGAGFPGAPLAGGIPGGGLGDGPQGLLQQLMTLLTGLLSSLQPGQPELA